MINMFEKEGQLNSAKPKIHDNYSRESDQKTERYLIIDLESPQDISRCLELISLRLLSNSKRS
jgi:hypothetical protein